jgi:DNA-binding CsgD family transcriptional regulator
MEMSARLTRREQQVLLLLVKGATDKEVAKRLGISLHTARTHHKNILRKTSCHNAGELVRFALNHHLVSLAHFQ